MYSLAQELFDILPHMYSVAHDVFNTVPYVQPCSGCPWYFATHVQPCSGCIWYFATFYNLAQDVSDILPHFTTSLRMYLILCHIYSLAQDVFNTLPHVQPCSGCIWYFATCTTSLRMYLIFCHMYSLAQDVFDTLPHVQTCSGHPSHRLLDTKGLLKVMFSRLSNIHEQDEKLGGKLLYLFFLIPYLWIRLSFFGYFPLKYHWPPLQKSQRLQSQIHHLEHHFLGGENQWLTGSALIL